MSSAAAAMTEHDVIVVGSGAAGGMAAHVLTGAGVRVLLLESGRDYDPVAETPMFKLPSEAPLHGASTPDKPFGFYDATVDGGWQVPGEPYVVAPGSNFRWWRARMLGGRTNHWGRLSLRFGPYDLKGHSRDGLGVDWPITYAELEPYYDKVERLIGVFGAAEGLENSPDSPPGILQPPPPPRTIELWTRMVLERRLGIPVVPAHMAILTRPLGDRPACFYATDCLRGCAIRANFQSPTVLLPPARATGNLTLRTNAHVYDMQLDEKGRARSVGFIDRTTGAHHRVAARAVVLAASSCESARILLHSRSASFPNGLANGSGQVGRNLMDTTSTWVIGQFPALENLPPYPDEGVTLPHVYSPWWGHRAQAKGQLDFARGYHVEYWGARRMPEFDDMLELAERLALGVGVDLTAQMRRYYGSTQYFLGRGEMLPNPGSFCELDPTTKDRWGLPVLRFHWRWGEQEARMAHHMQQSFYEMIDSMGGRVLGDLEKESGAPLRAGGDVIHEVGTCRMGSDRRDSVLDSWCRAWEVPNLYVVDGGAFASSPDKNPTLTILALAWRAAEHLVGALGRREA